MKTLIKLVSIIGITFFCACDDFLTRNPIDQIGEGNFYKNTEEVNKGVIACYSGLLPVVSDEWFLTETRSDNTRHSAGNSSTENSKSIYNLDIFRVATTHLRVKSYWEAVYRNIRNCNKVLETLDAVETPELKKQYEGEALFIRSLHYFTLVQLFGPVFLTTETMTVDESLQFERSSIATVYQQIVDDLKKTVNPENPLLPTSYSDADKGRVDIWAAKALLAKVYLTLKRYGEAYSLLLDVYRNSGYGNPSLSYADIFDISKEMNKEILFAVRFTAGAYGIGSPFASYFGPSGATSHIIVGGGDGFNCPTEDLLASYEHQEGSSEWDKRRLASFDETWRQVTGEVVYVAWMKKFFCQVSKKYDGQNDWPVVRFADVTLMLGEVENELNGTSAGLPYLNEIRRRAGLRHLNEQDIPTKTAFRLAMENERRWEFAGENQRLFDLIRTDRAIPVLNRHFATETIRTHSNGSSELFYMNPDGSRYPDVSLINHTTIEEWQLYLPIPFSVLAVAPNASQNYGY
ncbi:membrane protein [Bacteroidia bacterium]|nr:membrane protein [Bacteroidia bacterium]